MSSTRMFTSSRTLIARRMAFITRTLIFSLIVVAAPALYAQNNKDAQAPSAQVEVTIDQSSGKKTIKLKPQVLTDRPAYKITLEITYETNPKALTAPQNSIEETALARLECLEKQVVEYGDRELLFAVDGEPFFVGERLGSRNRPWLEYRRNRPAPPGVFSKYYTDAFADFQLSLSQIQKFAGATELGVGLGGVIQVYLDRSTLANIREFASEVARQASPQK